MNRAKLNTAKKGMIWSLTVSLARMPWMVCPVEFQGAAKAYQGKWNAGEPHTVCMVAARNALVGR